MHFYSYNWLFCNFFYLQFFCLLGNCTNLLLFSVCFLDKALISVIKNSLLVLISCVMLLILFSEIDVIFVINFVFRNGCYLWLLYFRSSHPEVFSRKGVLKICSRFTGEHPCRSAISIKLLCNFIVGVVVETNKLPVLVSGGGGVIIIWSIRGICYTFPVNCATCLLLLFIGISFFLSGYQVYLKTTPWSNLPGYCRSLRP